MKTSVHIKSRKRPVTVPALALLMLPFAAHGAADNVPAGAPDTPHEVRINGERTNDFKAEHAQSPKYTERLVDTPQSVIVIKRELFEQQGAVTLTEALRNTPGVGTFFLGENGSTTTGDAIYMRGFDTSGSLFVDGIRDVGSISRDVFNIEQIDVLKGPAGTDTGRSAPTGSINLATKQPQSKDAAGVSLVGGSAHRRRVAADVNRVLDGEGNTAFRLNVLDQNNGNPARDAVRDKRWAVAPSLAFGLKGPTRLFLDYLHVKQDNRPDGGVPTIGLPGYTSPDPARPFLANAAPVDPRNFYGSLSDFDRVKADMGTVIVEHEFSPGLRLRNTSRYGKTKQFYLLSAFMSNTANIVTGAGGAGGDPAAWMLKRTTRTIKDQENKILANQTVLTGEFATGALRHTLVAGLDLLDEKQSNRSYLPTTTGTLPDANLYRPDPGLPVANLNPTPSGARTQGQTNTVSGYLLDTIKVGERWLFGASVRLDHFDTNYDAIAITTNATGNVATPTHLELSDQLVSGKASILYKPTPDSSVYALWANSKQPPGSNLALSGSANSASNPIFDPQVSTTTELGAKWDLLRRKLALNVALYRTEVKNEVEQDPVDLQYYQTGRKRVQGVELGVTGEVRRNWLWSAGYAWMDTRVQAGRVVTASGTNNLSYTPKHAFTAWTSYEMKNGLKFGGGARYVGRLLRGTDGAVGTPAYVDPYWVVDAMADYRVNRWLDLQLNVYNLFDKRYVASINKSGYRYTPGAPRWASLTANVRF